MSHKWIKKLHQKKIDEAFLVIVKVTLTLAFLLTYFFFNFVSFNHSVEPWTIKP